MVHGAELNEFGPQNFPFIIDSFTNLISTIYNNVQWSMRVQYLVSIFFQLLT